MAITAPPRTSTAEAGARYLDVAELAEYVHSTVGSVRVKVSKREIPYIKLGTRVLFDREQIDRWLAEQRVESISD